MPSKYTHKLREISFTGNATAVFHAIYLSAVIFAVGYVCLIARDRYISEAVFKISKENSSPSINTAFIEFAMPGMADSAGADANICNGFIGSAELLLHLEEKFNLIEHYSYPSLDLVFRLDPKANVESRLDYYRSRIKAHYASETGLSTLSVDCFKPEIAKKIADETLIKAEEFINGIDQGIASQQLAFAQSELEVAENKVIAAHKDLIALQNKHQIISPDVLRFK
jgi:capsular polysaccharide transport system permease protein